MSNLSHKPPETHHAIKPRCGIIMPISTMGSYSASHWADVYSIISNSVEDAGFNPSMVSDADEVGVIHKRIIQNLYDCPIVVFDVSGKNPNVMFELGMRLTFDKPTIVVKDNETTYSFDTSPIEHLSYPRDLRFSQIVEFKEKLAEKIRSTSEASRINKSYSTFLKHFGEFTVPKIDSREVLGQEFVIEELRAIRRLVETTKAPIEAARSPVRTRPGHLDICMSDIPMERIRELEKIASSHRGANSVEILELSPDHRHLVVKGSTDTDFSALGMVIRRSMKNKVAT